MKKLYRIHFVAIAVIDLLLFTFFTTRPETALEQLLLSGFIFLFAQGLLLFRLVVLLKHQFAEIYPQINKKIRFYYLGVLSIDFLFFIFLTFVSSLRFSSLMPIVTACHSTFYYRTADYLKENYLDFYNKHISLWECLQGKGGFSMKKIIYIKTIQLLVIDGIMLAFLTFKGGLTWDWILIYSGWLIFFHPVLLTYLSNQLCDHFSHLYSQIRPRFWRFALQILLWDSLIILSLLFLRDIPLFLQGTLLILGHLIPSYRTCQSLKQDFPKAYQEQISFWSIL